MNGEHAGEFRLPHMKVHLDPPLAMHPEIEKL